MDTKDKIAKIMHVQNNPYTDTIMQGNVNNKGEIQ